MTELAAAYRGLSNNVRGALWIVFSSICFTLATTLIKFLGDNYGPGLQMFYRYLAAVIFLAPVIARNPKAALTTTRPGLILFRGGVGTIGLMLAYYAYQKMPLAEANALSFTRALWMVPLAAFVLREQMGPRRIAATIIGFLGVLLVLQPAAGAHVGLPAMSALCAALLISLSVTGVKLITRDHGTTVIVVWSAILGMLVSAPFALLQWRWPTPVDLGLLAAMGALSLGSQASYIKGMSLGDAAAMAPIDYVRLPFALLAGFALFHEIPNATAMLGAAIIIAAALFITIREAKLRPDEAAARSAPPD